MSGGRPEKPIDWEVVDKYLEAGISGVSIAKQLGISDDTLYLRCIKEKGCSFTEYSVKLYSKGDCETIWAHYDEGVKKRNTSILIKLYEKVEAKESKGVSDNETIVLASDPTMGGRMLQQSLMEIREPLLDTGSSGQENTVPHELGPKTIVGQFTPMHPSTES